MKVSDRKGSKARAQQRVGAPELPRTCQEAGPEIRGRLMAQAYFQNRGNLRETFRQVMGREPAHGYALEADHPMTVAFYQELDRLMEKAELDKDQVLRVLWEVVNISPLDFLDTNGNVLPMDTLKDLPRSVQAALSEIKVTKAYKPVRGDDGEYVMDPVTRQPLLRPTVTATIKMPEKSKAIQQLAQLLHWIEVRPNVVVNIAQIMKRADERAQTLTDARIITDDAGAADGN